MAQALKNPPGNTGDARGVGSIPGQEDPLEKKMAPHSSILAWEIHGQMGLAGYSLWGSQKSRT